MCFKQGALKKKEKIIYGICNFVVGFELHNIALWYVLFHSVIWAKSLEKKFPYAICSLVVCMEQDALTEKEKQKNCYMVFSKL